MMIRNVEIGERVLLFDDQERRTGTIIAIDASLIWATLRLDSGEILNSMSVNQTEKLPRETTARRVILESPFAGNRGRHIEYGRRALRDSLKRCEAVSGSLLMKRSLPVARREWVA